MSLHEVQTCADRILELLGKRIRAGELVIRFSDGVVQRCETRTVHEISRPLRRKFTVPIPPTAES